MRRSACRRHQNAQAFRGSYAGAAAGGFLDVVPRTRAKTCVRRSRARHESPPGGAESGFTVLAESLRITGA